MDNSHLSVRTRSWLICDNLALTWAVLATLLACLWKWKGDPFVVVFSPVVFASEKWKALSFLPQPLCKIWMVHLVDSRGEGNEFCFEGGFRSNGPSEYERTRWNVSWRCRCLWKWDMISKAKWGQRKGEKKRNYRGVSRRVGLSWEMLPKEWGSSPWEDLDGYMDWAKDCHGWWSLLSLLWLSMNQASKHSHTCVVSASWIGSELVRLGVALTNRMIQRYCTVLDGPQF